MTAPLGNAPFEGIRVVEVANWVAGPAACALFRDMGADVLKIEPPRGDALRAFKMRNLGYDTDLNTAFEIDNRGKRSLVLDLEKPAACGVVRRLARDADVFLTNLTTPRRAKYGLDFASVSAENPRVVYTSLTGYGTTGPDQGRPGFDFAAFWARSGLMASLGEPPSPPPLCRGGQGDHTTALNLVAADARRAARARPHREGAVRRGHAVRHGHVDAGERPLGRARHEERTRPRHDRTAPANPIWNSYADARRPLDPAGASRPAAVLAALLRGARRAGLGGRSALRHAGQAHRRGPRARGRDLGALRRARLRATSRARSTSSSSSGRRSRRSTR